MHFYRETLAATLARFFCCQSSGKRSGFFWKGQRIHGAVFLQHCHGRNIQPVGVRIPWTILKGCQILAEVPLRELKGVSWKLCHRRCSAMIQDQLFFNSLVIKGLRSAWNAIFRLECFVLKHIETILLVDTIVFLWKLWYIIFEGFFWWIDSSKQQHLFEIWIICNIINVLTVTFD